MPDQDSKPATTDGGQAAGASGAGGKFRDGQDWHVVQRLRERYGIAIERSQIAALQVAARAGLLLNRRPHRAVPSEIVAADWQGQAVICVLSGAERILVTVLPRADAGLKATIKAGFLNGTKKRQGRRRYRRRARGGHATFDE